MVNLATPFLSAFAVYFLPLNLRVTFLPLRYLPFTLLKVAFIVSFLADFLTLTFWSFKTCFTVKA